MNQQVLLSSAATGGRHTHCKHLVKPFSDCVKVTDCWGENKLTNSAKQDKYEMLHPVFRDSAFDDWWWRWWSRATCFLSCDHYITLCVTLQANIWARFWHRLWGWKSKVSWKQSTRRLKNRLVRSTLLSHNALHRGNRGASGSWKSFMVYLLHLSWCSGSKDDADCVAVTAGLQDAGFSENSLFTNTRQTSTFLQFNVTREDLGWNTTAE